MSAGLRIPSTDPEKENRTAEHLLLTSLERRSRMSRENKHLPTGDQEGHALHEEYE